ncbi:MAG TPA: 16S rRNA (guanine(966)-N(2))-methyltransferase RsmD [Devosia sp.]|nr:16S rRNA (guanine(966)-N(2))-methyltransferase RsmD [Devosia sp.]
MRIIAGQFRNKKLIPPEDQSIRPTPDRVRESVFNILVSRLGPDFSGHRVLDLFAGTGALGIEALSRGADYAMFVDKGVEARASIRQNMEHFGLGGQSKLLRRDATMLGPVDNFTPFDLVFCDPPYGKGLGEQALASARDGGWLAPGATIVLEEKRGVDVALPEQFTLLDQRTYGQTSVHFVEFGSA